MTGLTGEQFKSRVCGLQAMAREGCTAGELAAVRRTLHHEGWLRDSLLPQDWLYKKTEYRVRGRLETSFQYLSAEGVLYTSMKTALRFLEKSYQYTADQVAHCKQFVQKQARSMVLGKHNWKQDKVMGELGVGPLDTSNDYISQLLPAGWRVRGRRGADGRQFYLSPGRRQYSSLLSAVRAGSEPDTPLLRAALHREGWQVRELDFGLKLNSLL